MKQSFQFTRDFVFLLAAICVFVVNGCLFAWHIWAILNPVAARADIPMKQVIPWLYALMIVFWVAIWHRHIKKRRQIENKSSQAT
jgi:hypothetical protein